MGVGGSQPTLRAEVRLRLPEATAPDGSLFFARLHTGASNFVKYQAWDQPQQVLLNQDDIITVSLYTAQSESHFDMDVCKDFAEVYLPWEEIEELISPNREATFRMALTPGGRRSEAWAPSEFRDAFLRAQQLGGQAPDAQCLVVGLRLMLDEERLEAERVSANEKRQASKATAESFHQNGTSAPEPMPQPMTTSGTSPPQPRRLVTPPAMGMDNPPQLQNVTPTVIAPPTAGQASTLPPTAMPGGSMPSLQANVSPLRSRTMPPGSFSGGIQSSPDMSHWHSTSSSSAPKGRVITVPRGVASKLPAPSPPRPGVSATGGSGRWGGASPPQPAPNGSVPFGSGGMATRSVSPFSSTQRQVEDLTPEEEMLLRKMQVQNKRLREQLGFGDQDLVTEAEEAKQVHLARFEQARLRNSKLRAALRGAEQELATVRTHASQDGSGTPYASSSSVNFAQDPSGNNMFEEIQNITRENIELIRVQDEQVKLLQKELSVARRKHQQLVSQANSRMAFGEGQTLQDQLQQLELEQQDLLKNCQEIEEAKRQERHKATDSQARTIERLRTEHEVLMAEIGNLTKAVNKGPEEEDMERTIPATSVLSLQADNLQDHLTEARDRGQQEQESLEHQVAELRAQIKAHEDQLHSYKTEKEKVEAELQELKSTRDGAKAIERECADLREQKERNAGESNRCRITIRVYDEKIAELKKETDDIRRRVKDVADYR